MGSRFRFAALAAAVLLVMTACGGGGDDDAASSGNGVEGQSIRVAFSSTPEAIDMVGLKTVRLLEDQGVKVKVTFLDGGVKAAQAALAGQTDVVSTSARDAPNTGLVAFAAARPRNMYALVGRPGLNSLDQVRGKTIGAADPGSVANVLFEAILKKNGMSLDDVRMLTVGGSSSRTSALFAGKVDASMVYGDQHMSLLAKGYQTVVAVADEFPGIHDDLWLAKPDWLTSHEELAVAIAKAQLEAAKWFNEDKEGWIDFAMTEVKGLERPIAERFYDQAKAIDMYPVDGLMTDQTLTETYDFFAAAGDVEEKKLSDWSTVKYLDEARAQVK